MAAIGYRRGADGRLEQDPDRRIHETLSMVFRKFGEIGSVRQLALWLRQEGIELPVAIYASLQGRAVQWRQPEKLRIFVLPAANQIQSTPEAYGVWAHRLASAVRRRRAKLVVPTGSRVGGRSGKYSILDHHGSLRPFMGGV